MTTIAHQYQLEGAPKKWGERGGMGAVLHFEYLPRAPHLPPNFGGPYNLFS